MKIERLKPRISFTIISLLLVILIWPGLIITANGIIIPSLWNRVSGSIPYQLDVSTPKLSLFGTIRINSIALNSSSDPEPVQEFHQVRIRLPLIAWGGKLLFSRDMEALSPPSYSRIISDPSSLWQWLGNREITSLLPRSIRVEGDNVYSHNPRNDHITLSWQPDDRNFLQGQIDYSHRQLNMEFSLNNPLSEILNWIPRAESIYGSLRNLFPEQMHTETPGGESLQAPAEFRISGNLSSLSPVDFSIESTLEFRGVFEKYDGRYSFSGRISPFERIVLPKPFTPSYPVEDPPRGRLLIREGSLSLNGILVSPILDIKGFLPVPGQAPGRFTVRPASVNIFARMEAVPLQSAFHLIPQSLLGSLNSLKLEGRMEGNINIFIPTYSLEHTRWHFSVSPVDMILEELPVDMGVLARGGTHPISDPETGFRAVVDIPPYRRPDLEWMLKHSERSTAWVDTHWALFDNGPLGEEIPGLQKIIAEPDTKPDAEPDAEPIATSASGGRPSSPGETERLEYIYIDEISPYLVGAVLSAEDGSFFFHNGVYWDSVSNAIARNLREGEIIFGASTISMQLMKNLYLSADREYSRKLREVLLVYAMEEYYHLPKERILELYLNIVEFGPGVFGAQAAARYYFDIPASQLNPGQAAWLASILPSPKRYHRYYLDGAISPGWFIRMQSIMRIMLLRERITKEEFQEYAAVPPLFSIRDVPADLSGGNR